MSWLTRRTGRKLSLPTGETVRVHVDPDVDAATIVISKRRVARTQRVPGLGLVHVDDNGDIAMIEIFKWSRVIARAQHAQTEPEPSADLAEDLRLAAAGLVHRARESVKINS